MPAVLTVAFVTALTLQQTPIPQRTAQRPQPVGAEEGLFPYNCDASDLRFGDVVTLVDGSKHAGKVMEWANQVLLYEAGTAPLMFAVPDVQGFQFRRENRHKAAPNLPDLTVAYIERLPRTPSFHGHVVTENGLSKLDLDPAGLSWGPAPGSPVTFRVHVLNAGFAASAPVPCRVLVDDAEIATAAIPALQPRAEHVVEAKWTWQDGAGRVRAEIDPSGTTPEIVRWNNTRSEPISALAVAVVVAKDRYDAFKSLRNVVDSFCFEDWVRYQICALNGLFRASTYPSSPQGAVERLRCDRIVVVDDPANKQQRVQWEASLRRDGRPEGLAEYDALAAWGKSGSKEVLEQEALRIDWAELQELCRQLGLIDLNKTDTTVEQCMVRDNRGRYVQRCHLFPNRATLMYTVGGFPLDEVSVGALNKMQGRPRGFRGDFLYQLPAKVMLEVLSNAGTPLAGVTVDVFQLASEGENAGTICGLGDEDPLYSGLTDSDGRFSLLDSQTPAHQTPNGFELRPNPFGKIAPDGANGLLLLRLRRERAEEFYFFRLYDCNLAYLRGERESHVHQIRTRLAEPDAPVGPPYTAVRMPVRTSEMPPLQVCWRFPEDTSFESVEEFRVYKRTGLADNAAKPWTLASVLPFSPTLPKLCVEGTYFDEFRYDGPYSLDTFYAVSLVDERGRESNLAAQGCLTYGKDCVSFAMDAETAYITLDGPGPAQMLCWDGAMGTQHFGVRTRAFKGYKPAFAGVAVARDGRLIVADPVNHVLAIYNRADLTELLPNRPWWPGFPSDKPGEFYEPADVAIDAADRLIVADRNNNRVQILDSHGQFVGLLDGDFRFEGPHAVAYGNGHVCVTDRLGTRCRVYELQDSEAKFVRELPPLVEADRALVSKTGLIYVAGRASKDGTGGILVFTPRDGTAALDHVETEDIMGGFHRPRGLYIYPGSSADDWAYFVNQFPFDVRRCKLK